MGRILFAAVCAVALAACGGGGAAPVTGGQPGALSSLTVSHPDGAVPVGDTLIMQVEAKDAAGQVMADVRPQWASSDNAVATVDGNGVVRGMKAGAATITASATAGGVTRTADYSVAVLAVQPPSPAIASFVLAPAAVALAGAGATAQLEAVARDAGGTRVTTLPQVAWATDNAAVATVANGVVTGVAAGSATIRASVTAAGVPWSAQATVTVSQGATSPNAVEVLGVDDAFRPSAVTIQAGGTVTWRMVDEEHDVAWTASAPTGGNIGKMDRGTSVSRAFPAAGTYAYTCQRHDGKHGGTVTVEGAAQTPVFTSVRVTPAAPSVAVGSTVQLTATPLDQAGQAMSGLPAAAWSSADGSKATVNASGLVTGVAAGTVAVTARITQNGVTREAAVNVAVGSGGGGSTPAPSTATVTTPGTSFNPNAVTIGAGGTVTWQFTGTARHNVTFNGTAPAGGNIPDTSAGTSVSRTFSAAGTYNYECTRHSGMTGQVVVQP